MKNLKITKILLSLMLTLGLTTSSFAMGQGNKVNHDDKAKIEQKVNKKEVKGIQIAKKEHKQHKDGKFAKKGHNKKEVKIVKVYQDNHRHHHNHHKVHYSCNNSNNDVVAKCVGTGICLAMIAAINS